MSNSDGSFNGVLNRIRQAGANARNAVNTGTTSYQTAANRIESKKSETFAEKFGQDALEKSEMREVWPLRKGSAPFGDNNKAGQLGD